MRSQIKIIYKVHSTGLIVYDAHVKRENNPFSLFFCSIKTFRYTEPTTYSGDREDLSQIKQMIRFFFFY